MGRNRSCRSVRSLSNIISSSASSYIESTVYYNTLTLILYYVILLLHVRNVECICCLDPVTFMLL